nr:16S rRNA (guanine(527)-N(7))-methyltransferase RsmG [Novosphingobium sp.]
MLTSNEQARAWLANWPGADGPALDRLERLVALLREENARQNLVSAGSLEQVWLRHIADSAQLLTHVPRETPQPWIDLGSGAGFPGLVVAALRPGCEVVLVESRTRRIEWLTRAAGALGLDRVRVAGARLETIEPFRAGVISARAFAPLGRLLDLSARFSTSDTIWLLPKGRSARDEVDQLDGWSHTFHVEHSLTDAEAGVIVGQVSGRVSVKKGRKR